MRLLPIVGAAASVQAPGRVRLPLEQITIQNPLLVGVVGRYFADGVVAEAREEERLGRRVICESAQIGTVTLMKETRESRVTTENENGITHVIVGLRKG